MKHEEITDLRESNNNNNNNNNNNIKQGNMAKVYGLSKQCKKPASSKNNVIRWQTYMYALVKKVTQNIPYRKRDWVFAESVWPDFECKRPGLVGTHTHAIVVIPLNVQPVALDNAHLQLKQALRTLTHTPYVPYDVHYNYCGINTFQYFGC